MHKHPLLLLLGLLALAGCRTNPACERQIGLMRAELIALEDKYYLLEGKYRDAVGQSGGSCDVISQPGIAPKQPEMVNPTRPSDSDLQIQIDPNDASQSIPPAAPIGTNFEPEGAQSVVVFQTPARFTSRTTDDRDATSPHNEFEQGFNRAVHTDPYEHSSPPQFREMPGEPATAEGAEHHPAKEDVMFVDPAQIQARDDDGVAGADGLSLVVQIPSDQWSSDGELTLSLIDPNEPPERQRIGLWQFTAAELEEWVDSGFEGALIAVPLELAWNQNVPRHEELQLFVRWQNPQFPVLDTSLPIAISTSSGLPDSAQVDFEQAASGSPDWHPDR